MSEIRHSTEHVIALEEQTDVVFTTEASQEVRPGRDRDDAGSQGRQRRAGRALEEAERRRRAPVDPEAVKARGGRRRSKVKQPCLSNISSAATLYPTILWRIFLTIFQINFR